MSGRAVSVVLALTLFGAALLPDARQTVLLLGLALVMTLLALDWLRERQARRKRAGYVYLLRDGRRGVKIGRTNDPARRLAEHRRRDARAHFLTLWPARDAVRAETALHRRYAAYRLAACADNERERFALPKREIERLKAIRRLSE